MGRWIRRPLALHGGALVAAGAVLNAAGCLAPAILVLHVAPACAPDACAPVARALLGLTLGLDALFNLLLGLGLVATGASLLAAGRRPFLAALAVAAGLCSLPVALQIVSEDAAAWLAVAAPLWLAFMAGTAVALWRRGRTPDPLVPAGGAGAALDRPR